ncbi:hypothetical protein HDU76_000943 [Blyttiomyces sp. JEL0837]|nr:hypothetical protein HDU76_000943 [Blyttiomyces sp. JEL0837]
MNNGFTFTFTGLNLPTEQQQTPFAAAPFQQSNPLGIDVGNTISSNKRGPNTTVNRTRVLQVDREAAQLRKKVADLEEENAKKDLKIIGRSKFQVVATEHYAHDQIQFAVDFIKTREHDFKHQIELYHEVLRYSSDLAISRKEQIQKLKRFIKRLITYYSRRLAIGSVDSNITRGAQLNQERLVIRCFALSSLEFLMLANGKLEATHRADYKLESLEDFFLDDDNAKGSRETMVTSPGKMVERGELQVEEKKNFQASEIIVNIIESNNKGVPTKHATLVQIETATSTESESAENQDERSDIITTSNISIPTTSLPTAGHPNSEPRVNLPNFITHPQRWEPLVQTSHVQPGPYNTYLIEGKHIFWVVKCWIYKPLARKDQILADKDAKIDNLKDTIQRKDAEHNNLLLRLANVASERDFFRDQFTRLSTAGVCNDASHLQLLIFIQQLQSTLADNIVEIDYKTKTIIQNEKNIKVLLMELDIVAHETKEKVLWDVMDWIVFCTFNWSLLHGFKYGSTLQITDGSEQESMGVAESRVFAFKLSNYDGSRLSRIESLLLANKQKGAGSGRADSGLGGLDNFFLDDADVHDDGEKEDSDYKKPTDAFAVKFKHTDQSDDTPEACNTIMDDQTTRKFDYVGGGEKEIIDTWVSPLTSPKDATIKQNDPANHSIHSTTSTTAANTTTTLLTQIANGTNKISFTSTSPDTAADILTPATATTTETLISQELVTTPASTLSTSLYSNNKTTATIEVTYINPTPQLSHFL